MFSTASVIHLLTLVQHIVHGHHFHAFAVHECFEWVKVIRSGYIDHRLVCGLIRVSEHSASVTWR